MTALRARVVPVHVLSEADRRAMFALFAHYYDDVSAPRFDADLRAKDEVIVLRTPEGRIAGFSTLTTVEVAIDGRVHRGVFSGDTVVDEAFWGTRALGQAFLAHLFRLRLRRPLQPLWWFLISKGYKTYLLMANNFPEHWPRHEVATPRGRRALLDAFGAALFPDAYDAERGLVVFPPGSGRLRQGVAPASAELATDNPRVRFFVERNPDWADGVELACIAHMDWSMPARYAAKRARDVVVGSTRALLGRSAWAR